MHVRLIFETIEDGFSTEVRLPEILDDVVLR